MGGFSSVARAAAPMALAFAAPYASSALGFTALEAAPAVGGLASNAGGVVANTAAQSVFSPLGWGSLAGIGLGGLAAEQSYRQQRSAEKYQAAQMNQEAQFMREEFARREKQRRNLLAREQASARARLGALGIGSAGGSGDALLAGLAKPHLDEIDGDRASLQHRLGGMVQPRSSAGEALALNLLQKGMQIL